MEKVLEYDIVVTGSGSGGMASAISAARCGAKVLLVEKNGYVGGMTASGIPFLGYLDKKQRLSVGGFATEFVDMLKERNAALGIRYDPHHQSIVVTRPDEVKVAAAEFCMENGVDIILHSTAVDVLVENGAIREITYDCAGTRFTVRASVFIDGTGDGVISCLAGAAYEKGTPGVDLQPPSIVYVIGGVDKERFYQWLEENPVELGERWTMEYLRSSPDWCLVFLYTLFLKLHPQGKWPMDIWSMICINRLNDFEVAVNGPRMSATDATDPISVTKAEINGQKQAFQFMDILHEYVGGFEKAYISRINDSIAVRETRRVVGLKTLTADDVLSGRVGDDTIALGSYPVDIHGSKDFTSTYQPFDEPYGIPYLCTVSASIRNLMMCGRCISVDSQAFGSTRVMGTCFAVGEGVGIGAALAVQKNITPAEVDVAEIRKRLLEHGAILSMS